MKPETYWQLKSMSLEYDMLRAKYELELDRKRMAFLSHLSALGMEAGDNIIFNDATLSISREHQHPAMTIEAQDISFTPKTHD